MTLWPVPRSYGGERINRSYVTCHLVRLHGWPCLHWTRHVQHLSVESSVDLSYQSINQSINHFLALSDATGDVKFLRMGHEIDHGQTFA